MAAAAAEEKAEAVAAPAAPTGGGASKLPVILAGVNLLATLGMIGILFISFQREKKHSSVEDISMSSAPAAADGAKGAAEGGGEGKGEKNAAKKASPDFGKMVTLDQFTVNLSTPGSVVPKFVRVNISLEVPTDDVENEVNTKMPEVRNAVIDLFNSKRPSDLATAEGRDYLKDEIKSALNGFLVTGKVKGVFFTNFALSG